MGTAQEHFVRFEEAYHAELARLMESDASDGRLRELSFIEEACENSGSGEVSPDWLGTYLSVATRVLRPEAGRETAEGGRRLIASVAPAIVHAVRLGYTEGWFAAQDD